jgi:hypothetical protein
MEQQKINPLKLNLNNLVKRQKSKEKSYNIILNEYYKTIVDKQQYKNQKLKGINKKVVYEIAVKKALRPDRPSFKKLIQSVESSMKQKYSSKNENYNKAVILQIIKNKYCRINILYKEIIILSSIQNNLKRFYLKKDSYSKLSSMINYYKNYLKFFCKPTFKDFKLNNIIQGYGDNKAELYYKKNYFKNKAGEKNKELCEELKNIFNSSIKKLIDKHDLSSIDNEENIAKHKNNHNLIKFKSQSTKFNPSKEETLTFSGFNQTIKSGLLSHQNSIAKIISTFENDSDTYVKKSETNLNGKTRLKKDYFFGTLGNFKQKSKLKTKFENLFDLEVSNIKQKEPLTTRYYNHLKISPNKKTTNSLPKMYQTLRDKNKFKIIPKKEKINMKIDIAVNLQNICPSNTRSEFALENKLSRNSKNIMMGEVEDNLKNIGSLLNPIFSSANAQLNLENFNININNNFNIQSPRNSENEIYKQKKINLQGNKNIRLSSNNLKFHLKSVSNVYPGKTNKFFDQNKNTEELNTGMVFFYYYRK